VIRVIVVGCGPWGENLLRVVGESGRADVVAIADPNPRRRARAADRARHARVVSSLDDALGIAADCAVIATPPATHAPLALRAMEAGLDVFVEKPLAMTAADADRCALRAAALGRVGMVGHLLRYHPTVARLIELVHAGELGRLSHFGAVRFSIAGDRSTSTLWNLGPHDLSVLAALDPAPVARIESFAAAESEQVGLEARLESGLVASIELSRAHPRKVRQMRVVGLRKTALFDDVGAPDRLTLRSSTGLEQVRVEWREPLAVEVAHFLDCVETRGHPLTPFEDGAAIVRTLARIHADLAIVA
jgi:predicted dehydrogenase